MQRGMPHDEDAERAVLGSILIDNEAIIEVAEVLPGAEFFYGKAHRIVYEALLEMNQRGIGLDLVTVKNTLAERNQLEGVGGPVALMNLCESVPTSANAGHYAEIVRDHYLRRSLIQRAGEIINDCYGNGADVSLLLDSAERKIFELAQNRNYDHLASVNEVIHDTFRIIEERRANKGGISGLETGFYDLDDLLNGLQDSELIILAARPSMGKTSLALNIAEKVAVDRKVPAVFFSLEVGKVALVQNMLCSRARVNAHRMQKGIISGEDYTNLARVAGELRDAPFYINDESSIPLMSLRAQARRLKARMNIGLVVVDYIQLMEADGRNENRQQEITKISRGLKGLARELQVPVVALSQLNRQVETRDTHRPRMADLRESGSLEQDADVIIFLYREEYYKPTPENQGLAELIVAKQRHGPTSTVKVAFIRENVRFENLATHGDPG